MRLIDAVKRDDLENAIAAIRESYAFGMQVLPNGAFPAANRPDLPVPSRNKLRQQMKML
jgi:hypothetical protein